MVDAHVRPWRRSFSMAADRLAGPARRGPAPPAHPFPRPSPLPRGFGRRRRGGGIRRLAISRAGWRRAGSSAGQSTRLISVGSQVQILPGPPLLGRQKRRRTRGRPAWGRSSVGRAPALQAGGHRFDPVRLHHMPTATSSFGDCPCVGRKPSRDPALTARGLLFGMVEMVLWRVRAACPERSGRVGGGHACDAERAPSPSVVTASGVPAVGAGRAWSCAWRPDLKRNKGIWWMPWRQEAMKDVARCEKPRGDASDR